MQADQLKQSLKSEALRLGFDFAAVSPAVELNGYSKLKAWLEKGFHGEMDYLETRREAYRHPAGVLPEVKSVVMLGMSYHFDVTSFPRAPTRGRIARYAWSGVDYHDVIFKKLKQLCKFGKSIDPEMSIRGVVDTAPLLEREVAQMAGLGWHAKNTMLINREFGSWFLLAAILTSIELPADAPMETDHCGTCTACIDACPTDAFVQPGTLDATRCISYLTIEHRSPIPIDLRGQMGDWILGCDICQDVCPWNNKAIVTNREEFAPKSELRPLELADLFLLSDDQFRERFRKTPLWRPKRRGILRNAAIALGNQPSLKGLHSLEVGINDTEPLIRGASAWAIGQHSTVAKEQAVKILRQRQIIEDDEYVVSEIKLAIEDG